MSNKIKQKIINKFQRGEIVSDLDFDVLPLKEQFDLIDKLSIEQLMSIKEARIKPEKVNYKERGIYEKIQNKIRFKT